jgi:hypothetical protein
MQQGEESEESGNKKHGLEGTVAGAGFSEVAELGDEAGAEEKQDDGEVPEHGEKIEAVAGAGVGDGFLVFLRREVVGGGGILGGCGRGGSGNLLSRRRRDLGRNRVSTIGARTKRNRENQQEKTGRGAEGREEAHGKSITADRHTRARVQG